MSIFNPAVDFAKCIVLTILLLVCVGKIQAFQQDISADQVFHDDLYLFGDDISIDGEINGDLLVAARVVRLNGTVTGDFMAAAQAIEITGHVGDDVRVAAHVLKVHEGAVIGDDLIGAAFSLEFADSSVVDSDLIYAGYQALVSGAIGNDAIGSVANCEIAGHIGGDVKLKVNADPAGANVYSIGIPRPVSYPNVPAGLTIRASAQIDGDVDYESPQDAMIEDPSKIVGHFDHERPEIGRRSTGNWMMSTFLNLISMILIGMCVLLIAPKLTQGVTEQIRKRPLASVGRGFIGLVGLLLLFGLIILMMILIAIIAGITKLTGLMPVAIVLGLTSIAVLVVGFWFFASYLAAILTSVAIGRWVLSYSGKSGLIQNRYLAMVIGLVLLVLVLQLPFIGTLIGWLVILICFGAVLIHQFAKAPAKTAASAA